MNTDGEMSVRVAETVKRNVIGFLERLFAVAKKLCDIAREQWSKMTMRKPWNAIC